MARSPAEIQADIAVTRRVVEQRLDGLRRRLPDRWWMPYAMLAGALVTGALLSRVPLLRLVGTGTRAVNAGLMIASTVASVDRFVAQRDGELPARRKAA
jgi:hypothetical protein